MNRAVRKLLVVTKRSAYDLYVVQHNDLHVKTMVEAKYNLVCNLTDRHLAHSNAVSKCHEVLEKCGVQWQSIRRDELREPIQGVDLVITIGGDGTMLETSHFLDDKIPMIGINSDPTKQTEVEERLQDYDAKRSTGYLCAATTDDFEQVLDEVLSGTRLPTEVARIKATVDGALCLPPVLNDVLLAHPSPASVSRCNYYIQKVKGLKEGEDGVLVSPSIHSRSSGLRVCTAVGSTAATRSAGGFRMPFLSKNLQYMLREPLQPHPRHKNYLHGLILDDEVMKVKWGSRQGRIFADGSHLSRELQIGSSIEITSKAPVLQLYPGTKLISKK
ncbi:hypothetical protein CBR_g12698 [Chara braunii]|uniref:NADH kinase n=1 Tax=Chara braunii TaxID=69332 RepID=A0A388KSG3_CHABU|nr:hypothetical protein CBR_g12698 [Chara braunii]|eukprot:GBG72979.1 hypothetical protein CBR_g12698 [Chara braunii]